MKKKRIMIIAGGEWQVPIVRKAKDLGLFVVNTNLYPDSPGFEFADIGLVANVLDKKKNLEYAGEHGVDAVITDQSDIAVTTVAYVAEQLGLPGIGINCADLFTNKNFMREFCREHSFPTPQFKLCHDTNEAIEFVDETGLPVVIKPPANQSSRGVAKVTSRDGLVGAFESALLQSSDGTVLIESFVGGTELTVDGIQLNAGGHYCLATSSKAHYAHNQMVASQLWFSQYHEEINYDTLHQQHDRLIKEMSLPFGLTHAEYKYHEGKFYLIEVAARGGGTRISSDVVTLMSGIDSNELLIRMALGEPISSIKPAQHDRVAVLDFFEFMPGKVTDVYGVRQAAAIDGVASIGINVRQGEEINPASDDRTRHGYVIAYADTSDSLRLLLNKVRQTVQVYYE
jgi:carbamoyl-phosphate synthase large subunit